MTGQLRSTFQLGGWGALFVGLYWTSVRSYLLFHSLAEGFSIAVAAGIFFVAWNARGFLPNGYLLFLGIASLFVAFLDLLHTLAYKGMGVFSGHGADLPTQLWIAARYMGSISFLLAPSFLAKQLRPHVLLAAYTLATGLILLSIFTWGIFPTCYIEGVGLTPFKRASEYIISLGLGAAILLLLRNRHAFDARVLRLIVGSIGVSILSELSFTLYLGVYDLANLLGHY
ncbi:MAG TPA: MASE3 domain-containing protein, partial [Candidatus Methylomirabilis sp.]|nr:MASE3 domain-containing protein [Candidatus Methylomirabilis sp.]